MLSQEKSKGFVLTCCSSLAPAPSPGVPVAWIVTLKREAQRSDHNMCLQPGSHMEDIVFGGKFLI